MKMNKRPFLLLANDDGYNSKGMNEMISVLRPIADICVIAPDSPRSGFAGAITITAPLRCTLIREEEGLTIYKCNGTPVDCVKLALDEILDRRPDVVISGINHGDNSSINVHYSGTMGATFEGCLKGIPSIGFSLCDHSSDADFRPSLPYVKTIVEQVLAHGLPRGVCLNVNFPKASAFAGVKICRQTRAMWLKEFEKSIHPNGSPYYWMTGEFLNEEPEAEDTDQWAIDHDYVAVTPVQIDMTAYSVMDELKSWQLV